MSFAGFTPSSCPHGLPHGSKNCWGCAYNKNYNKCMHNHLESECKTCRWKQPDLSSDSSQNVCQHWISVTDKCYICEREKKRLNHFHNETIKVNENNFFGDRIMKLKDYVDPNSVNNTYPRTVNEGGNTFEAKSEISGREYNNRTKDMNNGNINSFMKRSLETVGFIEQNNNKNLWHNSIANNSFPNLHMSSSEAENTHLGISTRGHRKLDGTDFNNNLHLRRSMLQPDFRQGNRFYEDKPSNTRRNSYRGLGNQNAQKFQDQTKQMYSEMDYTKAYDRAAGINRG